VATSCHAKSLKEKKEFLVVYDYGTGDLWATMNARAKDEITQRYPMLRVQDARPAWMTDDLYEKIISTSTFDIDHEPSSWLLTLTDTKPQNE
jgi:hypothetical protein